MERKSGYSSPMLAADDILLPQDIFASSFTEGGVGAYSDDDVIDNGEY